MTTTTLPAPVALATPDRTSTAAAAIPWYLWAVAFASTSVIVGVIWDISWHRTIGRDTFWTAAHLAIYLGGAVAGLSCGWLVLATTFRGTERDKTAGVRFWGFRGPLGAWVCIWGSFAMITSGPLDDWWHNAYGLDVEILSPPHIVLAAGILAIQVGAMLMALARQNNAPDGARGQQFLFIFAAGVLILMLTTLGTEYITYPNDQHGPVFLLVSALIFPFVLVGLSRSARFRWGATAAATVYVAVTAVMIWILQLFEAQPMLPRSSGKSTTWCLRRSRSCSWYRRWRSMPSCTGCPPARGGFDNGAPRWAPAWLRYWCSASCSGTSRSS